MAFTSLASLKTDHAAVVQVISVTGAIKPGEWLHTYDIHGSAVLYCADEDRDQAIGLWPDALVETPRRPGERLTVPSMTYTVSHEGA